jgi:two-component system sensor kinase FixL
MNELSLPAPAPGAATGTPDSRARLALTCMLVCVGYYVGAKLGLALTFQPHPVSVLWPPNAILFAALLLVHPGRWVAVLAAALPAHLLAELQGGIPLLMVLSWYVSNVAEAVIGATCVVLLTRARFTFDSPRNVLVFAFASLFAALSSSFLDAGFVALNQFGSATYWENWIARVWSNVTTSVMITAAIVAVATHPPWRLPASPTKVLEGALLVAGLLATTYVVFDTDLTLGFTTAQVCLPLPFLLWAALRFGPAMVATAFAGVSLMAIWGAGHAVGALGIGTPIENARSVQLFVISVGPTLLCLAAALRQRRWIEDSLRMSDKRFRVVLEATRDTVYDRALEGDALWWGHEGISQFGYPLARSHPTYDAWLDLVHPDDRERIRQQQLHAMDTGGQLWEGEYRLRRANDSYAHVHEQAFIVRDGQGRAVQVIGALTDITERRDTDELSQRLAQASRLTSMGELTASIAHEINQPMAAILTNVDAAEMLLDAGKLGDAELRAILDDIRNDDLRAGEVIRHIRELANKHQTEFEPFDANELVRAVLRLAAPVARRRGVTLRAELGHLPIVRGDRIHIQQVLLNLVFNAMDAMADTPLPQRRARVSTLHASADRIEISVADRGHGVPPDRLKTIFDSFYTTKADGMGLGLSISRTLVHAHGGTIWAENNADTGATIRFTLPVTQPR